MFWEIAISPLQTLLSPDPVTLEVRSVSLSETAIVVTLVAAAPPRACPLGDRPTDRVQSRYWRTLDDLPVRGIPVRLRLHACRRKVFAERLGEVARVAGRRTRRLRASLRDIGLACQSPDG